MFVQTEITPNPNSLKFLPGKNVSNKGSFEITQKDQTNNELVKNLLSINGVEGIFLGKDFISINKYDDTSWDEIKHIVISLINDFYSSGKECVVENTLTENNENLKDIEKKIVKKFHKPVACSEETLKRVHSEDYIKKVKKLSQQH